jgi:hypothetical protein
MASDRALYLVAVGVLALGLGNSLANHQPNWLRGLADHSISTAQQVSGRAQGYLGMAQFMFGRSEAGFGRTQALLGTVQAHLGEMQANLARHQAEMARMQAENIRVVTLEQMREVRVACPRVVVQVSH